MSDLVEELTRQRDEARNKCASWIRDWRGLRDLCRQLDEDANDRLRERDEARAWAETLQRNACQHSIRAENAERERDEALEKLAEAKREAENLARSIYRTEYSDNDTGWELLESVAGVISQIDNMYAGVREQRDEARRGIHLMAQNAELWKERAYEAREPILAAKDKIKELEGQVSYARHERNKALNEIDGYKATFDVRWQAQMRAVTRWQEETKQETMWPGHEDLCLWLIRKLEAAK